MNDPASLTARGLKQLLSRGGVDYQDLQFEEHTRTVVEVHVTGTADARRAAHWVLMDQGGLRCSRHHDHDVWFRW